MRNRLVWLPLGGFAVLFVVVAVALLHPADRTVRSTLVDAPLPAFTLPPIVAGKPGLSSADFGEGRPRLLNVFASWCIPCMAEAPQLMRLRRSGVEIDGLAIRDRPAAISAFLARNGDPYARIGDDRASATQVLLGSSGVPETFLIDGRGRIVRQYVGDIRADQVDQVLADLKAAA